MLYVTEGVGVADGTCDSASPRVDGVGECGGGVALVYDYVVVCFVVLVGALVSYVCCYVVGGA